MCVVALFFLLVGSAFPLQVMKQRTGFVGVRNWILLGGGAIALGAVGIWCMHFVGMMALSIHDSDGNMLRMGFEPGLTVVSLVVAITIIGAGFALAGDPKRVKVWRTCCVGVIGGGGVSVMHYVGMMSMKCQAEITWNAGIIAASVIVGIVAATAALLIFFHLSHIWQDDMRLQIATACLMGVAVCGMHYTGLFAASWKNSFVEPNFGGYADNDTLTGVIVALAVVTCAVLLAISFYRYRMMQFSESRKTTCLTLAALVRDSQGRVLATLTSTLPSVVIDAAYVSAGGNSHGTFTKLNPDFLRMLKISFSWSNAPRYQRHLTKLHAAGSISTSSLKLFDSFIQAANKLSRQLNIPLAQMGFLYFSPTGNMVTLIAKSSAATSRSLEASESGLRFMQPAQMVSSLSQFQFAGTDIDPLQWLADVKDYARRVMLPLTGESRRDEMLNDFLRETATELFIETDMVEDEIRQWRAALGRYVSTKHHLALLAKNAPQWSDVKLEPMVKAQIDSQLECEAQAAATNAEAERESQRQIDGTMGHIPAAMLQQIRDSDRRGTAQSSVLRGVPTLQANVNVPLYLGFLYVQVTSLGLRVLLPRDGPLTMIPIVKFPSQHSISSRDLEWLRDGVGRRKLKQSSKLGGGMRITPPNKVTTLPTNTLGEVITKPNGREMSVAGDTDGGVGGRRVDRADRASMDLLTRENSLVRAPRVLPPSFVAFKAEFLKCVDELAKVVGTKVDLTMENLWTESVITLSPEVNLVCFIHSTMQANLPSDYPSQLTHTIPFPIFEILHFSQHTSRAAANWTRKLVAATVNTKKKATAVEAGGEALHAAKLDVALAHVGNDDTDMNSIFGSEKTQHLTSQLDNDFGDDESGTGGEISHLGNEQRGYEESSMIALSPADQVASPSSAGPNGASFGTGWSNGNVNVNGDGGGAPLPGQIESTNNPPPKRANASPSQSYLVLSPTSVPTQELVSSARSHWNRNGQSDQQRYKGMSTRPKRSSDSNAVQPLPAPDSSSDVTITGLTSVPSRIISVPMPIGCKPAERDSPQDVVIHVHSLKHRTTENAIHTNANTAHTNENGDTNDNTKQATTTTTTNSTEP